MKPTTGITTLLALLVLAACTETRSTTEPQDAAFQATAGSTTGCDLVSDMISGVFNYYPHPERVAARQQMRALGDACSAGDGALVTTHAIAFLEQIQGFIESGRTVGDAQLGAWLVNALLTCTTESLCLRSALLPPGVQNRLQEAMTAPAGTFAVRKQGSADPVLARAKIEFTNPPHNQKATNRALWGAETSQTWTHAFQATRFVLIYGWPRGSLPAELNGAGIFGLSYEFERFPNHLPFRSDDVVHVGVCFDDPIDMPHDPNTGRSLRPLMQRRAGILTAYTLTFCPPQAETIRMASVAAPMTALVRSLLPSSWFRVVNDVRTPHIGGSALDFSPFSPVGANSSGYLDVTFNLPPSPLTAGVTSIGEVTARAYSGDGTLLESVAISIAVYNNRGEPAGAFLKGGPTTGITAEANLFTVTFPDGLYLDKTGGYRICVNGAAQGFTFPPVCTGLFHVRK